METKRKRKGKRGPLPGPVVREAQLITYMTKSDVDWMKEFARTYRFKSQSQVVAYCLERLIEGGFSVACGISLCRSMQAYCRSVNPAAFDQAPLDWANLRPPPAIPNDHIRKKDVPVLLSHIRSQLLAKGLE